MAKRYWLAVLLCVAGAAQAEDRELCPDRPGIGSPPCIVDKGRLLVEVGGADWTREDEGPLRTDTWLFGDTLLRLGLNDTLEAELGWTPFGHVRGRDRASGEVERTSGVGDVTVALKQSLASPDGSGFSVALLPFATLPTGRSEIGAGDWGAGLRVPVSYELSDTVSLTAMPEVDAEVDEDGDGRHLAFGSVAGLTAKLSETVSGSAEVQWIRDRDPEGHASQTLAGLSLAWQPSDDLQLDTGSIVGLNRESPDVEVYVGISRRF